MNRHRAPRARTVLALVFALCLAQLPPVAPAQQAAAACPSLATPVGALAPAIPIWCQPAPGSAPATFVAGPNSWVDDFDYGAENKTIGDGYLLYESQGAVIGATQHWRAKNHWMTDIQGGENFGGALMRPDRSFRFVNGKLVVEAAVSAGLDAYNRPQVNAWPEIVVSLADRPTDIVDNLYAYGMFKGKHTVGCRLEPVRESICAYYDDTGRGAFDSPPGRVFEISFFQDAGGSIYGGYPANGLERSWRTCARDVDPDLVCRDLFRWEITKTKLSLYVNGTLYMEHTTDAARALPDALINGDVFVYFADWVHKPEAPTVRFHWDRLAVNPPTLGVPPIGTVPAPTPVVTPAPDAFRSVWIDQSPYPILAPGATARVTVRFRNTGSAPWIRGVQGQQANLGIPGDSRAFVALAVDWPSADRPAIQREAVVEVGDVGIFDFVVRAPLTPGTTVLPLRPVIDGITWMDDQGVFVLVTAAPDLRSSWMAQSPYPTLSPNEVSPPLVVTFRNVGGSSWVRGGPSQANLGIPGDDRSWSGLGVDWPTPDRVAVQAPTIVPPGGLATFTFRVRAPTAPGVYRIPLRPVVDGITWLEDDGVFILITVR